MALDAEAECFKAYEMGGNVVGEVVDPGCRARWEEVEFTQGWAVTVQDRVESLDSKATAESELLEWRGSLEKEARSPVDSGGFLVCGDGGN